jgi:hypothetical protein
LDARPVTTGLSWRCRISEVLCLPGLALAALACSSTSQGGADATSIGVGGGRGGAAPATTGSGAGGSTSSGAAGSPPCTEGLACDPANCGSPGHDCLGGECVACACQPVRIATLSNTVVLAMAVDAGHLFLAENAADGLPSIVSIDRSDWTSKSLATWPDGEGDAKRIFVRNGFVYFYVGWPDMAIKRVPIDGSAPPEIVVGSTDQGGPLAIDDTDIYHLVAVDPTVCPEETFEVRKTSLTTGESVALVTTGGGYLLGYTVQLALDDTNVYGLVPNWATGDCVLLSEVFSVPKAGGPKVTLLDYNAGFGTGLLPGSLMGLAGDKLIFWRDDDIVRSFASLPSAGGALTDYGVGDGFLIGALDETGLAWIDVDDSVSSHRALKTFSLDGSTPPTATEVPVNSSGPYFYFDAFAMDDRAVFWELQNDAASCCDVEVWMLAR